MTFIEKCKRSVGETNSLTLLCIIVKINNIIYRNQNLITTLPALSTLLAVFSANCSSSIVN